MNTDELTDKELALINNIINKLQIHMEKTQQTLYNLSVTLGFEYQPFYRLMKNKRLPTISSLAMITEHLQCTIEELISDKILVDINLINTLDDISLYNTNLDDSTSSKTNTTVSKNKAVKISIPVKDYMPYIHDNFFAIKFKNLQTSGIEHWKTYFTTNTINTDGIFLVNYQDKIVEFNVISTSSKFIIIESNNQESRILQSEIKPLAKFFNNLLLFESDSYYLQGVK